MRASDYWRTQAATWMRVIRSIRQLRPLAGATVSVQRGEDNMALDYVPFNAGVRFHCTTSEVTFGPVMPDEDWGGRFVKFLGDDPRKFSEAALRAKWHQFIQPEPYSETAAIIELGKQDYDIWAEGRKRDA